MNRKVEKLSESVINQIAAGEVVENPASIVKELIENSVDAGARRISIEIGGGGQQLIRVEDDGCGMGPEEALLSLERHATSKIRSVEDLESLGTLGFRGEALAAISAVSHFEMRTSNGTGAGTRILVEGGKVSQVEPCARNRGTTIEVRSLFYNVPARKKFQKSPLATGAGASRAVEAIALAHPALFFSFNGREWVSSDLKTRVEEILGEYEHLIEGTGISGFAASPARAGSNRSGQHIYVNQRPIFSPLISKAVKEGYGTRIKEQSYPRFILFLTLPPDQIDVNVHPQKREVRFRDEGALFRQVQKAVEKGFAPGHFVFPESLSFTPPPPVFSFQEPFLPFSFEPKGEERELKFEYREKAVALFQNYLLLEKEGLLLVDLKGAHARLLFDSIKKKKGELQPLLWPLQIPLEKGEEETAESLASFGIECRLLNRVLLVDALPSFLDPADFPDFFCEWKQGKKEEQIVARFCRNRSKLFSLDEALLLWEEVQKCADWLYDPLGKAIFRNLKESDFALLLNLGSDGCSPNSKISSKARSPLFH